MSNIQKFFTLVGIIAFLMGAAYGYGVEKTLIRLTEINMKIDAVGELTDNILDMRCDYE